MKTLSLIASLILTSSSFAACASAFSAKTWSGHWQTGQAKGDVTQAEFGADNTLTIHYSTASSSESTVSLSYNCDSSPNIVKITGKVGDKQVDANAQLMSGFIVATGYIYKDDKPVDQVAAYLQ